MPIKQCVILWCTHCGVLAEEPGEEQGRVWLTFEHGKPILPAGWYTDGQGRQFCSVNCYCLPVPEGLPVVARARAVCTSCGEALHRRSPCTYTRLPPGWTATDLPPNPFHAENVTCPTCNAKPPAPEAVA